MAAKTIFTALALSTALLTANAADTLIEFNLTPGAQNYASTFANFSGTSGLGNSSAVDFDGDGFADDSARGTILGDPGTNGNYNSTGSGTIIGPTFGGREGVAIIDSGAAVAPNGASGGAGVPAATDRIRFQSHNTGTTGTDMMSVKWFSFQQAAWENHTSGSVFFDSNSSFSVAGNTNWNIHLLVEVGGGAFIAQNAGNIADLSAATFVAYADQTNGYEILWDKSASTLNGSALTGITGIGIYGELLNYDGTAGVVTEDVGFLVTAVPEPSTYALMLGALLVAIAFRRRRV